jgi:16S rRNA G966 N2-methylase RsmD
VGNYTIHNEEFVSWAQEYVMWEGEKFHAVFCDPPYGISFMCTKWDDHGGPEAKRTI